MIKLGLMFSGQGSQYTGMGKSLADKSAVARRIFAEAGDLLGYDLAAILGSSDTEHLAQTEYAQPAIYTYSYAWYEMLTQEYGINPAYGAGHSLGEYTALTCAGAMTFAEGLHLVRERGKYMQQATGNGFGRMAAIQGLHPSVIQEVCARMSDEEHLVQISNYNTADQIVISGESERIDLAGDLLSRLGGTVYPIHVSAPFHTPYMNQANAGFGAALRSAIFNETRWPVISNVDAEPYRSPAHIRAGLDNHMLMPVRWLDTLERMIREGVNVLIEVGPRSSLRNMARKAYPHLRVLSCEDDGEEVSKLLKQYTHRERISVLTACSSIVLLVPNRNGDNSQYVDEVIQPHQRMIKLQSLIQQEGRDETRSEQVEAIHLLQRILQRKGTSSDEAYGYYSRISEQTGLSLVEILEMTSNEKVESNGLI
ncbi:ACP S-malonyltransferase [Paenibacillus sp.]